MTLTPKQRIVNKANLEIRKDISQLVLMAKLCGLGELLYYLHYLHFSRLVIDFGDVPDEKKAMLDVIAERWMMLLNISYKLLANMQGMGWLETPSLD